MNSSAFVASCVTSNAVGTQTVFSCPTRSRRASFGRLCRGLLVVLCGMAHHTLYSHKACCVYRPFPTSLDRAPAQFSKVAAYLERNRG